MTSDPMCSLCGIRAAGSREHLPGIGAANVGPVAITYFRAAADVPDWARFERIEDNGFIVRTICSHCNSRTGGHYGTAYKDFVTQFSRSGMLDAGDARTWVSLRGIQPLRVLKQMTSMFIAAQGDFSRSHWLPTCDFVLKRDVKLGESALRYYVYRNVGTVGRVTALISMMSYYQKWPPIVFCEIAWPPLGIVFTTDEHPLLRRMKDITAWGQCGFRERVDVAFSVPQLQVATHWPLGFGSTRDAHAWAERDGIMALVGPPVGDDANARMSVLTRASRRGLP